MKMTKKRTKNEKKVKTKNQFFVANLNKKNNRKNLKKI